MAKLNKDTTFLSKDGLIEKNLNDEFDKVSSQLAQTAKKEEVFLKQYGININDFDESTRQTFLEQQGIDVNYVLGKGNVKLENLAILKESTNLFNKDDVLFNTTLSRTTGNTSSSEGFITSGFIEIKPNTEYFLKHVRVWVLYDASKSYVTAKENISATHNVLVNTTSNSKFLRIAWLPGSTAPQVDEQQINEGGVLLPYEPFYRYIDKRYVEKQDIQIDDLPNIPPEKLNFMLKSTNLFNKDSVLVNTTLSRTSGNTSTATDFITSDFIEIKPNTEYFIKHARVWVLYDEFQNLIASKDNITAENNILINGHPSAKYMRLAWLPGSTSPQLTEQQVNEGTTLLPYEPYDKRTIPSQYLPDSQSDMPIKVTLPPKIYGVVGKEISIYFQNILNVPLKDVQIDVSGSVGKQLKRKWVATPTYEGTYPITIAVYKNYKFVTQAQTELVVKNQNVGQGIVRNAMIIGDSTVTQNWMLERIVELFSDDQMTINFVGTRGSGETKHEGRAGWDTSEYRTDDVYQGQVNPFYNPATNDFDFSYYMANQSVDVPDYVSIVLGINDTFNYSSDDVLLSNIPKFLSNMDFMINSIKTYNSNIKVGIAVTIPPVESQDQFGDAYNNSQVQWRYKRNNAIWIEKLVEHFKGRNDVYLVPENSHFDAQNGLRDGVHPNETVGDKMRGETYYYWFKSFES